MNSISHPLGKIILCLLFVVPAVHAQQATAPDSTESTRVTRNALFVVSYEPIAEALAINSIHQWLIHVATEDGEAVTDAQISVVGGMPVHDHGLPTLPQMTKNLGDGTYLVEGMKFHMAGWWQITVSIDRGDVSDIVVFDLVI
jgi:hypothetical protein